MNNPAYKSLLQLKSVKLTCAICITAAVITSILITITSDFYFRWDYRGLNNLLEYFKIPIGITALIIPIIALIASNHRSEQTKEQISLSEKDNKISNYYKHAEAFEDYLKEHSDREVKIKLPRKFHRIAFPNAKQGDFSVDPKLQLKVDDFIKGIAQTTTGFTSAMDHWRHPALNFQTHLENFRSAFYLVRTHIDDATHAEIDGQMLIIPKNEPNELIKELYHTTRCINDALHFETSYQQSTILTKVIEFDFNSIPILSKLSGDGYKAYDLADKLKI